MLRAAHRWNNFMEKLESFQSPSNNLIEVYYEDLIEDTGQVLEGLCAFLGLPYEEQMDILKKPPENLGETKGIREMVADNKNKFTRTIPRKTVRRIEEIVCDQAKRLNYSMVDEVQNKPLKKVDLFLLKIYDGLQSAFFHVKDKGIFNGVWYFFTLHKYRSWVNAKS